MFLVYEFWTIEFLVFMHFVLFALFCISRSERECSLHFELLMYSCFGVIPFAYGVWLLTWNYFVQTGGTRDA